MLARARALPVDELVIDLEDAVAPDRKPEALQLTLDALATGNAATRTAVRVNPVGSAWHASELRALTSAAARPDSIVLPKAEHPDELRKVLDGAEGIGVQALVETATALAHADELGATPGVKALILGYADLAVSLGRSPAGAANLDLWLAAQDRVLVAARAAGIHAIDGPFLKLDDEDGLVGSATRAADLGFDGKWAIHPSQVEPIAHAFRPDEEAITHAREVIAALKQAPADGAIRVGGQMVDEPVRLAAVRTLERAGLRPQDPA
jgi:citrate lyase subunit beta/citryl-CoA lyase